jgi:hypothetical protein
MRVAVFAAPRSGNHWLKCLLAHLYGLRPLAGTETPTPRAKTYRAWIAEGGWPDGAVFHQHARFSPRLCDAVESAPARIATIVRDPYDAFVSLYHWVQGRDAIGVAQVRPRVRPRDAMIGKPLDHPDVVAYLRDDYGANLATAEGWLRGGRAVALRYERLHADPAGELRRAAEEIAGPVPEGAVAAAVDACTADRMRLAVPGAAWSIRSATVGESRAQLSEVHLAVFRECHAEAIRALGYEVR